MGLGSFCKIRIVGVFWVRFGKIRFAAQTSCPEMGLGSSCKMTYFLDFLKVMLAFG